MCALQVCVYMQPEILVYPTMWKNYCKTAAMHAVQISLSQSATLNETEQR